MEIRFSVLVNPDRDKLLLFRVSHRIFFQIPRNKQTNHLYSSHRGSQCPPAIILPIGQRTGLLTPIILSSILSFSSGPSSPTLFFSFPNYTRILLNLRHLFLISLLTILSVSLYLYSLSYLSIRCACVVIYVACSWYTPPSQKSFSFSSFFPPLLSIQIYCSSPCTDRQYLLLPLLFDPFS